MTNYIFTTSSTLNTSHVVVPTSGNDNIFILEGVALIPAPLFLATIDPICSFREYIRGPPGKRTAAPVQRDFQTLGLSAGRFQSNPVGLYLRYQSQRVVEVFETRLHFAQVLVE